MAGCCHTRPCLLDASMSTYDSGSFSRGPTNTVRHSKEDALDDRDYELLLEGASRMDDYYGDQATFAILVLGRLGLRRGELTHMRESWVDWRQEQISVPLQQDCHGERDGDGPCGTCRQLAKQRVEYNEELSFEEALADQWHAKTPAAARDVYFGFDARARLHMERFFDKYDGWAWAAAAVNRRIKRAAERADGLDPDDVYPHALRATAASYHAGRGLETLSLMQMMGWAQLSTAQVYVSRNSRNTARQLDAIHQG